ncbi:MAG TPA: alpha/beta fold hydrolase [Stellaceae bacterium]|nr:alpha/beta fold hydrolase [Stellaceae bacterium]
MRALLLVLSLFTLGLTPAIDAAASPPAHFTDSAFIAGDGAALPLRRWLPAGPVKAVILALHGFNDYGAAFNQPALAWAARGIATYAYDQRGFGAAPERGLWAGDGQLAIDAITASRILRLTYPGRPIYLLGESMGGGVAILAATGAFPGAAPGVGGPPVAAVDGVILSAPAVWGRATMDLLPRLALFAGVRLFPATVLTGSQIHIKASDNLPMLRALARDPLVIKGARIATLFGLVNLMDDALAAAPRLAAPTLLLYGAHDEVVPHAAMTEFVTHLPPDPAHRRRLAYYPAGYHMLLRDLDGALVTNDVANWALNRAGALPSGADTLKTAAWPPHRNGDG